MLACIAQFLSPLASVVRIKSPLAVMLIEATNDGSFVVPLIIVIYTANAIGALLSNPVYEAQLKAMHVPMLGEESTHPFFLMARHIMAPSVETVSEVEKVGILHSKITRTSHHAFPVLRSRMSSPRTEAAAAATTATKSQRSFLRNSNNAQSLHYVKNAVPGQLIGIIHRSAIMQCLRHPSVFESPVRVVCFARGGVSTDIVNGNVCSRAAHLHACWLLVMSKIADAHAYSRCAFLLSPRRAFSPPFLFLSGGLLLGKDHQTAPERSCAHAGKGHCARRHCR